MPTYIGTNKIKGAYIGTNKVKIIYVGTDKVYSSRRLPSEYQEVEYIESLTLNNYVNTDYIVDYIDLTVEYKFQKYTNINTNPFGLDNGSSPREMHGNIWAYTGYLGNGGNFYLNSYQLHSDIIVSFTVNSSRNVATMTVNGVNYTRTGLNGWTGASYSDYIFATNRRNLSAQYNMDGRIYYLRYYRNGILDREFIPCYRISDNVIGFYETQTNTFKTNAGTGTFTKGPDVN